MCSQCLRFIEFHMFTGTASVTSTDAVLTDWRGGGIEPPFTNDKTKKTIASCDSCQQCCTAPALQRNGSDWQTLTPVEADLQSVIATWKQLP
jgi:epoxyqueuosine reductase QueG